MAKYILTDTGFWIGLLDSKDQYHESSNELVDLLSGSNIILPWPCLYETFRTKYSKRKEVANLLEVFIKKNNIIQLCDKEYREVAYANTIESMRYGSNVYSLVDNIIREMILDINLKIDLLVTFNERDFADVCARRKIGILSDA